MTYRGRVQGGVVVLEPGLQLPEGTEVRLEPVSASDDLERLREGLLELAGTVTDTPADLAEQHDHYIHGSPKK